MPRYEGLHPMVVHFPIALLLVAPVFIVLAMCLKKQAKAMLLSALVLVLMGTAFAFLATSTGEAAEDFVPDVTAARVVLGAHEEQAEMARNLFAGVALLLAVVTAVVWVRDTKLKHSHVVMMCGLMLLVYVWPAVVLMNAGHEGARLVHEFGARAPMPPTGDPVVTEPVDGKGAKSGPVSAVVPGTLGSLEAIVNVLPGDVLPPDRADSMNSVQSELLNDWVKANLVGRRVRLNGTFENAVRLGEVMSVTLLVPRTAAKDEELKLKMETPASEIKSIAGYVKGDPIEVDGTISGVWFSFSPKPKGANFSFGPQGGADEVRKRMQVNFLEVKGEAVEGGKVAARP
jgi:uncharacterized membrane protein